MERYPLTWPTGVPRTPADNRTRSKFSVTFGQALNELMHELKIWGAADIVISSNVETRRDGLPYAGGPKFLDDPGIAVYWSLAASGADTAKRDRFVMASDAHTSTAANLRAIGKTIEALRAIDRYGTKQLRDRAFEGFKMLPASTHKPWREVLGFGGSEWAAITRHDVNAQFRRLAKERHSDAGGSTAAMVELNRALKEALEEVKS